MPTSLDTPHEFILVLFETKKVLISKNKILRLLLSTDIDLSRLCPIHRVFDRGVGSIIIPDDRLNQIYFFCIHPNCRPEIRTSTETKLIRIAVITIHILIDDIWTSFTPRALQKTLLTRPLTTVTPYKYIKYRDIQKIVWHHCHLY